MQRTGTAAARPDDIDQERLRVLTWALEHIRDAAEDQYEAISVASQALRHDFRLTMQKRRRTWTGGA